MTAVCFASRSGVHNGSRRHFDSIEDERLRARVDQVVAERGFDLDRIRDDPVARQLFNLQTMAEWSRRPCTRKPHDATTCRLSLAVKAKQGQSTLATRRTGADASVHERQRRRWQALAGGSAWSRGADRIGRKGTVGRTAGIGGIADVQRPLGKAWGPPEAKFIYSSERVLTEADISARMTLRRLDAWVVCRLDEE